MSKKIVNKYIYLKQKMDYEIKIINDAVNNTINGNYPNIEWGFNNKI